MAKRDDPEAMDIYQRLLDVVDQAFMARDPDAHAKAIYVPHHIRTPQEMIHIRTPEDLRAAFFRYLEFTDGLGGTTFQRQVLNARFRNKDAIEGVHEVNITNALGEKVIAQSRTTSIVMRMNGAWRICGSDNTTRKTTGVGTFLHDLMKQNQVPESASRRTLRNMTGETS